MARTLLWLLASLGLASVTSVADAAPLKVMSAPNVLRVGTAEKVFVECQDCGSEPPMNVEISVWNFPTKHIKLKSTTVALNPGNKYQGLGELVIPPDSFDKDPNAKQFVYLCAAFPGYNMEKVVLVSFQSGFLFIQTDKTLYTPESTVLFRIFGLTPGMKPVGTEATGNPASVAVEIVTPEGIVFPLGPVSLRAGMHSGTYQLGEIVSVGQWKVVSRFQSNPQQTYSAEFEVKKYVLPSFEVKLLPAMTFYYVDSQSFTVEVKAKYLFGKEVDGMAYVVFGVIKDGNKKTFPASLQRIPITDGNGEATLQRDHILKTFPNIEQLVGGSLFVTATVFTDSGTEMVEGELRAIQIVTSPYSINFKKTSKYFKAGLSFDVTVTVANPDGSPAEGVPVVVDPGNIPGITGANGRATLTVNTEASAPLLTVTARTNDGRLPAHRQTSQTMVATPQARSQNYIHINVNTADVKLGTYLKVNLILNHQPNQPFDITYLIQSRGQLVQYGRQASHGQMLIALIITVTKKMLPSFRLIVYYHPSPTEVVSDSVWVDVDDSCMGTLKLEPVNPVPSYEPWQPFNLRVTGDTGATVGLVAVDKGVYVLNNKHRLTQEKVWEIVEKADTGCSPGGGKDSMGVFFDAGLLLQTDTASGTPARHEVRCPSTARKRRASTSLDAAILPENKQMDKLERECCLDGMKDTPLSYDCATRKLYITDGKACEAAFLHCCVELQKQRSELKRDSLILAHSEEDDSYMDSSEIASRTRFPESWQWLTFTIPPCTGNPNCEINTHDLRILLPDSITTWQFTGISLSENSGICVGKPLEVVVLKPFFIDLKLPYSAVTGEQIEIRAILHNYLSEAITVRVELIEHPDVCSSASKRHSYTQQIKMGPSTTRAVPFVIIPMKEGELNIEVKATVKDSFHSDGVVKTLRVVPNGVLTKIQKIVELDPKGGTQELTLNNAIPRTEIVPGTKSSSKVFVTGAKLPDYDLHVELTIPDRAAPYYFRFNKDNYYTTRTSKNFDPNENVKVTARGTGKATLTLVTQYYAVPREAMSDCTKFNLSLEFTLNKVDENEGDIYNLRIEFFFKDNEDASMSVIDIAMPTGFMPMTEDLDTLSEGRALSISRWEFNRDLSEKGSIILYLDKVAHSRPEELAFRMRQTHKVGILQPAAVSIYEYYDATKCVRYYHPQRRDGRVLRLCKGNECLCAEENCSMQKKGKISNQERIAKACESTLTTKIDFVYKVTLEEVRKDLSFDIYLMRIDRVIKNGKYDTNPQGQLRQFLSFPHCRESLNLQKQKGYLIMGTDEDILPDPSTQSFKYLLGERTWVEYWPRGEECQTEEYRPTCLGLEDLIETYELFGCV